MDLWATVGWTILLIAILIWVMMMFVIYQNNSFWGFVGDLVTNVVRAAGRKLKALRRAAP